MTWKNTTDRPAPRERHEFDEGDVSVLIYREPGGKWKANGNVQCYCMGLDATELDEAKREAIEALRNRLIAAVALLDSLIVSDAIAAH